MGYYNGGPSFNSRWEFWLGVIILGFFWIWLFYHIN